MSLQREELLALGAQTSSGESSSRSFPTATMLEAHARVTTGTLTFFDLWLQFSDDDVVWFDAIADLLVITADSATEGTARIQKRDIIDNKTTTTAENFWALYKHMPARYVRAKWKLTGSTVTVALVLTGK